MARFLALTAAAFLVAGCSSSAKLSVSSATANATAATPTQGGTALQVGNVTVDQVTMVARHLELEGGAGCEGTTGPTGPTGPTGATGPETTGVTGTSDTGGSTDDGDDESNDGCELKFGPFPVVISGTDLAAGTVNFAFDVTVPVGDYEELKILVDTIPANKAGSDPILQAMAAAKHSMEFTGTVLGSDGVTTTPFTCSTNEAVLQQQAPFSVPAAGTNVTLLVDPSTWFTGSGGASLDPSNADQCAEIIKNVRASLKLFKDGDQDGEDDATENGGDSSKD
jgi:hypothetical protein